MSIDVTSSVSSYNFVDNRVISFLYILVSEQDNLEITMTKTCLDVLKQLGEAFSSAMDVSKKGPARKMAPYVLRNETGLPIILDLEHSVFKVSTMRNLSFPFTNSLYERKLAKQKKMQ